MKTRLIILLLLAFCSFYIHAQSSSQQKKAMNLYELATEDYYRKDLVSAGKKLEKALRIYPDFSKARLFLAQIHEKQENWDAAYQSYEKALKDTNTKLLVYVNMAKIKQKQKDYDIAIELLNRFLQQKNITAEAEENARNILKSCRFRIESVANNPVVMVALDSNINTGNDEFINHISLDGNTLVFTRKTQTGKESFYMAHKKDSTWSKVGEISLDLSGFERYGAITLSPDGKYLAFAGLHPEKTFGRYDIFIAQKTGNDWSTPTNKFRAINTEAWESQPNFSSDGKTLYFVSNRKNGLGKTDIWYSEINEDGIFRQAKPVNKQVNTSKEDAAPFMHFDHQSLYFSSDGQIENWGKKDLYFSKKLTDSTWAEAVNLGNAINTAEDEINLIVAPNAKDAYVSKYNPQTQSIDIYQFELPQAYRPQKVSYVKGHIYNVKNKQPVYARMQIVDLNSGQIAAQTFSDKLNGEYLLCLPANKNYAFSVEKSGFLYYSVHFSLTDSSMVDQHYEKDIFLQPIEVESYTILSNVFFETDKAELKPASFVELNKLFELLDKNPSIKIEISGHTDNTGSAEHNQGLSEQRAKSVYDYLLTKGILSNRMTHIGYGYNKPIAPNDTEEGRMQNRRTEFKIIEIR